MRIVHRRSFAPYSSTGAKPYGNACHHIYVNTADLRFLVWV